jgi:protein-disulfide isomerase-like protein with CxxC motif
MTSYGRRSPYDVAVTESVDFFFDPRCPWCYQTSRWALRLQELGVVTLEWFVFCLELRNFDGPHKDFDPDTSKSAPALRTSVAVRAAEGNNACGRFYAAIGQRYFFGLEDLAQEVTIRSALADACLDPDLYDRALSDPSSWNIVVKEHEFLVQETGAFGVPSLRLHDGQGQCMFGPVIREVPEDAEALELFERVVWLMRNQNFYELKSGRTEYPDLPHITAALARRGGGDTQ